MGKGIITIDCDNVLVDTASAFLSYYKQEYGMSVKRTQIKEAFLQDNDCFRLWSGGRENYLTFFERAHTANLMQPIAGSLEKLSELQSDGYELHVVTGRVLEQKDMTQSRIDLHFPGIFEDIHYAQDHTDLVISKGELCQRIGAKFHVDDFLHYALQVTDVGIPVLLLNSPWNIDKIYETNLIYRYDVRNDITLDLITTLIDETTS